MLGGLEAFAQRLVGLAHRVLEARDGALGGFGCRDQLGDGLLHRRPVGLEPLELLVETDAIEDREQQQDCDQALDRERQDVDHCVSILLLDSSAFSNIAKVVWGLRRGLATRTATRSPTLPMRPSLNVTSPQRTRTM